ncbi:hypothetical protein KTH_57150 [Thermosporothrix hazakensis]|jgi:hypothetical protein|uniref:Uncharacterized protein n=1 Tax=Thermosporothrix sp. COM3 TaxID=2490863 RepID=A0A455SFL1_9CHLR|nr:hypothetical protein KTC_12870 [Thermosporothrix sp. COM3]GCE50846.1 hypothetical protein KTH_57150 [Thermosporothrix hazakensis]
MRQRKERDNVHKAISEGATGGSASVQACQGGVVARQALGLVWLKRLVGAMLPVT